MMRSYGISSLLDEYHRGSRQWMYDKVNIWLDMSLGATTGDASRLFLLLADAVGAGSRGWMHDRRPDSDHTLECRAWANPCSAPSCTTSWLCEPTAMPT